MELVEVLLLVLLVEIDDDVLDVEVLLDEDVELVLVLLLVDEVDIELLVLDVEMLLEVLDVEVVALLAGRIAIVAAAQNLLLFGVNVPGSSVSAANSLVEKATLTSPPPDEAPLLVRFM